MDRTQGRRFVAQLRDAGLDVVTGAEVWGRHEVQDVDDVDWIPWAAANGCVGVTADEKIRYKTRERIALVRNRLQVVCFPHNNLLIAEQVRRLLAQQHRIEGLATKQPGPWLASLYEDPGPDGLKVKWRGGT